MIADVLQQIIDIFHTLLNLLGQIVGLFERLVVPIITLIEHISSLGITK